jgi:hypothetical protein
MNEVEAFGFWEVVKPILLLGSSGRRTESKVPRCHLYTAAHATTVSSRA